MEIKTFLYVLSLARKIDLNERVKKNLVINTVFYTGYLQELVGCILVSNHLADGKNQSDVINRLFFFDTLPKLHYTLRDSNYVKGN